jgi:ABC-2 type transport system ATP-binding protein
MFGKNTVIVEFEGDPRFADELQDRGAVKVMSRSHNRVEMKLLDGKSSRSVLDHAVSRVDEIYRYELVEPPLSEIFVEVVRWQQ